jgi:hypothetical protein
MLINFFKKIFGLDKLEKRIRLLERKNYWREKYKNGLPQFKPTSNLL